MARKSRIEPVREFLRNERELIRTKIGEVVDVEDYAQAEYLKGFRDISTEAISLCGDEKSKGVTDGA